jgi:hypothetical protein
MSSIPSESCTKVFRTSLILVYFSLLSSTLHEDHIDECDIRENNPYKKLRFT